MFLSKAWRVGGAGMLGLGLIAGIDPSTVANAASPGVPAIGNVTQERLLRGDDEPRNWLTSGRNFKEQHHSSLTQINAATASRLGFAWEYPVTFRGRSQHSLQATPLVVDGVMFTSGPWGTVYALDAQSGKERWRYDPDVDGAWARRTCCGVVNRGVAVWKGRVYVGTVDGYLVSLDAATGELLWKTDTFTDRKASYSITSAPWIAGDKVIIGNAGADMVARGYISAYEIGTGKFAWRFYTVPGDPAKGFEHPELAQAAKTWSPNSNWALGGGGTAWGYMAWDPQLNLLYVGTGNGLPWPVWLRSPGGGDNLYLTSILAIHPDTGRLAWHYQTSPGDLWDYTATQNIILAELEIQGKLRKVLMQAPKNGFFYVLDRVTGELLSAKNFVPVNWASHIDLKTGRPVLTGQADYEKEPKVVMPGPSGAHNWPPMAFSPQTGLVYIPAWEAASLFARDPDFEAKPASYNLGALYKYGPPFKEPLAKYAKGFEQIVPMRKLLAWDPVTQREVWSAPGSFAGVLSTAGNLVVQGTAMGQLIVYNARSGAKLKVIETGTGIMASPMSYAVNGEQYIAVMAGAGGSPHVPEEVSQRYANTRRILAFKLNGGATPLPPLAAPVEIPEPPAINSTPEQRKRGEVLFTRYCRRCHTGGDAGSGAAYPDLTQMAVGVHQVFEQIVLDGVLSAGGMASFSDVLNKEDAQAIHVYLIEQTLQRRDAQRKIIEMR